MIGKKNLLDIFSVGVVLFFAGGATAFSRSIQTWEYPLAIIILLLVAVGFICRCHVPLRKCFLFLIFYYLIYFLLLTFKFEELHYKFLLLYPLNFLITYAVVMALGLKFFFIYEELIKKLCVMALIFWIFEIIFPVQLISILKSLTLLNPYNEIIQAHVFVFTVVNENVESFLPRNAGFAWEPGAFSVFINFAIFVNLIRNKFRIRKNINILIFVVTLITTQSTTGYSIFLLICMFYIFNIKNKSLIVFLSPMFVLAAIYIVSLPFMYDKITQLYSENVSELVETGAKEWNNDNVIYAQRFVSFQIDFIDFLNNPILGYGGHDEDMWTKKANVNVVSISGIGKILARFGLVGFIFFITLLYKSSKQFSIIFNYRGSLFLFILMLQVSVSYSLIENPIFLCFWMFSFFMPKDKLLSEKYSHGSILYGNRLTSANAGTVV